MICLYNKKSSAAYDPYPVEYLPIAFGKKKKIEDDMLEDIVKIKNIISQRNSKSVFKFRSITNPYHLALLSNRELYFASFSTLNDPFEGKIPIIFDYANEVSKINLRNFNKREIRASIKFYKGIRANNISEILEGGKELNSIPTNQKNKHIVEGVKDTLKFIEGLSSSYLWEKCINNQVLPKYYNGCGVLSLSGNNDNNLLWSHYGDSHQGFCVEFDYATLIHDFLLSGLEIIAGDVEYIDEYPERPVPEKLDPINLLFFTKSKDWEYEREIRVISKRNSSVAVKFSTAAVKNIFVGLNVKDDDLRKIIEITQNHYPKTGLYEAIQGDDFSIKYRKI